ncbi:hypothetical protein PIB30_067797 [Stylosanthes scabra]|uniref:Uncharacterized protein n=1 Tax=Stylosanthes scabra TaxID=79078 RepID=A0ABU6XKJ2_9FABA|nr:hypothetical protein [Stylosanthes scabra]
MDQNICLDVSDDDDDVLEVDRITITRQIPCKSAVQRSTPSIKRKKMSPPQSNGKGKSKPPSKSLFFEPGGKRSRFHQAVQAVVLSQIISAEHFADCPFEHADFSGGWSSRTIDMVDNVQSLPTSKDNSAI